MRIGKFTGTEGRTEVARGWGSGKGKLVFNSTEFMLGIMTSFGYRQWGWQHNTVKVLNASESYTYM